jgi:hypothetical protein
MMPEARNLRAIPTFPHLSIDGKWGFIYNNNTGRWIYPKMSRKQSNKIVNVTCSVTDKAYTLKIDDLILETNGGTPDYVSRVANDRANFTEIKDNNTVDVSVHVENFLNFLSKTLKVPREEILVSVRKELNA